MKPVEFQPSPRHQAVIDRFVTACQADERVVAAFLGGSNARGAADAFSDLDLYLVTTDAALEDFAATRTTFLQQLGEPLFIEDFGIPGIVFYILADGTEGELGYRPERNFQDIHYGAFQPLVDKTGILVGASFPRQRPPREEQAELLRRQIAWFWHELSHFITALGRGKLWWAHGQLEALRLHCLNLARLEQDFFDDEAGSEGYFKVEKAVPTGTLLPLEPTYCPLEAGAMLRAVDVLVGCYRKLAGPLGHTHGIAYPAALEQVLLERLENIRTGRPGGLPAAPENQPGKE